MGAYSRSSTCQKVSTQREDVRRNEGTIGVKWQAAGRCKRGNWGLDVTRRAKEAFAGQKCPAFIWKERVGAKAENVQGLEEATSKQKKSCERGCTEDTKKHVRRAGGQSGGNTQKQRKKPGRNNLNPAQKCNKSQATVRKSKLGKIGWGERRRLW